MTAKRMRPFALFLALLILLASTAGVSATWVYTEPPPPVSGGVGTGLGSFQYGLLYITEIGTPSGTHTAATVTRASDTAVRATVTLAATATSTASVTVTFYNNTTASYYYNGVATVSEDNADVDYAVTGLALGTEIPAASYTTLTITFSHAVAGATDETLNTEIRFLFTVDPKKAEEIAAETTVGIFENVINNQNGNEESFKDLSSAMSAQGTQDWQVSFIGNVPGASNENIHLISSLFGEEFTNMDLNGDGTPDPLSLIIKRENIDGNNTTGDTYTYQNRYGNTVSVPGAEMTIYMTYVDVTSVSLRQSIVVYAASYTKAQGSSTWLPLIPMTKGTANANRYDGYPWGNPDSFDTDTWRSDDGKTIEQMVP